jgi:WD40 repeat protein
VDLDQARAAAAEADKKKQDALEALKREQAAREAESKAKNQALLNEQWALRELERTQQSRFTAQLLRAAALLDRDPGLALDLLHDTEACPFDLRDFSWGIYCRWTKRERIACLGEQCFALSPDGKTLATHWRGQIQVWDIPGATIVKTIPTKVTGMMSMAFLPDGKTLLTVELKIGPMKHPVKLWDVITGQLKTILSVDCLKAGGVPQVALTPDGKLLAVVVKMWDSVGEPDVAEIALWEVLKDKPRAIFKISAHSVYGMAFSPDGNRLAILGRKYVNHLQNKGGIKRSAVVQVWDAGTAKELKSVDFVDDWYSRVAFTPDGRTILTENSDPSPVRVWDSQTLQEQDNLKVQRVALPLRGDLIAMVTFQGTIELRRQDTRELVETITEPSRRVFQPAFSADGRVLASFAGGLIKVWDVDPRQPQRTLLAHQTIATAVAFTRDGRTLASGGADGAIHLWDAAAGKPLRTLLAHETTVSALAWRPDGLVLASGAHDETIKLWDVLGREEPRTLRGHQGKVTGIAFRPGGKVLASSSDDGTVKLWEVNTGQPTATLKIHGEGANAVAFSGDDKYLAVASPDGTVTLWNPDTGQQLRTLRGHGAAVYALAFSPDGATLASGGGGRDSQERWFGEVKLWDVAEGKQLMSLQGHAGFVVSLAFAPDGKALVSASEDQTVRLWDVVTGQERLQLKRFARTIQAVAWRPDARVLAVAGAGKDQEGNSAGAVWLWEAPDGADVAVLKCHQLPVVGVALSADGKTLWSLAAGDNAEFKQWDLATGAERATAAYPIRGEQWTLSADGQTAVCLLKGGTVLVLDPSTGQERQVLALPFQRVVKPALSADGRILAVGGQFEGRRRGKPRFQVHVIDVANGKVLFALTVNDQLKGLALSPDGKVLALGWGVWEPDHHVSMAYISVHDATTGKVVNVVKERTDFLDDAFWPSNRGLVALPAQRTRALAVLQADGWKSLQVSDFCDVVALSRDNKLLAAACRNGILHVWDLATGKELAALIGHNGQILDLCFSDNGAMLVSAGTDGSVRLWDMRKLPPAS